MAENKAKKPLTEEESELINSVTFKVIIKTVYKRTNNKMQQFMC